ncbi:bifunctional glutamine-synthetase adenylyltransferase/deadenyltransferase [Rothia kristinae]|uniref:Bifunctional glutamine-synthetase adenylyltransferase/deadenyltransferase n=1 Tax=Rothia kristinae TaxID=37923 RepID=A0A1S2N462_9MICC|nr:bifunctional [glutamine synthetase] adenylyltransferase/[glutamine synthetase]-adenylyl-L-tyrosine phosphorylase [Rothia kristinae]OIJ37017.1 bifunctional glutamine-synthetase adenylyltransferase/deadenyltransferase [Rothia kristinae]
MTHAASGKTRLAGIGFEDLTGAQRWLQARELEGIDREALLEGLRLSPSPDAALKSLVRLLGDHPAGLAEAVDRGSAAPALYRVLGASEALGDFLLRRPEHLDPLTGDPQRLPEVRGQEMARQYREDMLRCVGADPDHRMPVAETTGEQAQLALRTAYRAALTRIAVADLLAEDPLAELERIAACLADLAGAALEAALAVARAEIAQTYPEVSRVALAVIGMGKCGARELNYISDVDVIYAVGPAQPDPDEADGADDADDAQPLEEQRLVRLGEELVRALTQVIHGVGPEPALWEVDANLRPEGKDGPLVRTVDSHRAYCRRWAENWEFQALLKARPIAGDPQLGRQYLEAVTPFVWEASSREGFVGSVQAMRRRVSDHIPEAERERQIKLGIGGLRDVEFTVQLLQLVHGRTDEQVRTRGTLESLRALAERSYISREDARAFADRYRWLRLLEHRVQLRQLRRTHLMPAREREQLAVVRAMQAPQERTRTTAEELLTRWREAKRSVRGLHEALFFRPLLAAVAHLSPAEVALSPDAARDRLAALGYLDPQGAMRHIEALTRGVSRRAEIQKTVLPVLLGWFARGVDPDAGLLNFRRVSEELGQTPWYLKMLRDSATAAQRLCEILSSSRFATDLIEVEPEAIAWLDKDEQLRPETLEELWTEIRAKVSRHRDAQEAVRAVRLIRRREMLRTAMGECTGVLDAEQIMRGLSDADQAAILGALHVAERELYEEQGEPVLTDVVIIGMGRQGGAEIGYGSDADVMYVHRAREGAGEQEALRQAERLVTRTVQLLKGPVEPAIRAERTLVIDADLRPEGRSGPMVRSLDSYAEYYARWSDTWEHQALLRARPLAGSAEVAEAFVRIIDPYRYPAELPQRRIQEIRRMKARVEAERMPRGADPSRQLKLGRGGLSDVEWLVQLLQLRHAHEHPELRTTSTLRALRAAVPLGLIGADDAHVLESAWLLATRIRGGVVLRTGRASDSLPTARRDLEAIARWVGCAEGGARVLEEDYLRLTRRARGIYENLFYGPLSR